MIFHPKPNTPYDHGAVNQQFEQMLPRIQLMALGAFRDKGGELRCELTAEVVARAYAAFVRLAEQGRSHVGFATPLALFSIRQVKSGRRMGAKQNINDVGSDHAQINRGIRVWRLDRYNKRSCTWKESVVEDRRSGPAEVAAFRIDFDAWLATLARRERRIAKTLATGETTGGTARKFGLSPSRISQMRGQLRRSWQVFQGELLKPAAKRKAS